MNDGIISKFQVCSVCDVSDTLLKQEVPEGGFVADRLPRESGPRGEEHVVLVLRLVIAGNPCQWSLSLET